MTISSILSNKDAAYFTKSIAGAVFATTALKAVGRPAFIYADKNSDPETKKYTAGKEFLYQLLCLGLTFAMIKPAQKIGYNFAKKHIKDIAELKKITNFKEFELVTKDLDDLTTKAKEILGIDKLKKESKTALKVTKGGVELGSFIGSILGLTIVAPLISHQVLHPIMKAFGMDKKHGNNIGKPTEIFLADAKIPTEKVSKFNASV